jgi:hypothetical protein
MDEEVIQPPFIMEETAKTIVPEIVEETKEEKFKRLAEIRVNNIMSEIEMLDTLATNEYEYTQEQAAKMFTALENELQVSKKKFSKHKTAKFTF